MSAALDNHDERLLADVVVESSRERRPVLDRLRELVGNDLLRLLLFGLAGQRGGAGRRSG
ncbi:MAG: hypothetical protein ACXVEM_05725 [Gaiellaceae bacterium]